MFEFNVNRLMLFINGVLKMLNKQLHNTLKGQINNLIENRIISEHKYIAVLSFDNQLIEDIKQF